MDKAFRDLIEFHRLNGDALASGEPSEPSKPEIALRRRLVTEEYQELIDAIDRSDITEIADACADLVYVVTGTALRYGIDLPVVWDAVHDANVRKFGPGSWRDETGKVRKPPGWTHPDIASILADQLPLSETYGREDR